MRLIDIVIFKVRWWRWLMSMPNEEKLKFHGYDEEVRDIIYERWKRKEPKRFEGRQESC